METLLYLDNRAAKGFNTILAVAHDLSKRKAQTDARSSHQQAMGITTGSSLQFTYRSATGATSVDVWGPTGKTAPYWVRVVREGDSFSAHTSPDNVIWTRIGNPQTIAMGAATQVGMFSTNNSGELCTSTFDNVAVLAATQSPFDS